MNDSRKLEQFTRDRGATVFGVANLERLRKNAPEFEYQPVPKNMQRAVVIGMRLQDAVVDELVDRPTPLYFHMYRQANYALDRVAFELTLQIQNQGGKAIAVPASQVVERNPMRGAISHRLLGWDAGIGWIGRSTLLVHPQFGSRMRYASVLTDLDLPAGQPMDKGCGSCLRCVDACPAKAICKDSRDFDLDSCYGKLDQFRKIPYVGQHICGICVRACGGPDWPHSS